MPRNLKKMFLPLNKQMYWAAWQLTGNAQEAEDLVQGLSEIMDQARPVARHRKYRGLLHHFAETHLF